MKPTLRLTLTTILLSLLILAMGTFGISFYRNARYTATDLSSQVLEQTSALVDAQINDVLHSAVEQGRMNLRLIQSGAFRVDRFEDLARYWLDVMEVHPRLTRLQLVLEGSGDWYYVDRPGGVPTIGTLRRDGPAGERRLSEYRSGSYPGTPTSAGAVAGVFDPRARPWYVAAKAARRQVWSDTYLLRGSKAMAEVPGITCASPILADDGSLVGVLGASFDVVSLGNYLRELKIGSTGFAFVVERRSDGSRRVIAHKDPKILLRPGKTAGPEGARTMDFVPVAELADGRVSTFLDLVPEGVIPSKLKGATRVEFANDGVRYLGTYACLSTLETPDWLICLVLPESDVLARVQRSNRETVAIGLGVLALAMAISFYVSTQVARPLERIARQTEAIGRIDLEPRPVAHSIVREVDRLALAVERTRTSLRSFRKYVPAELIRVFHTTGLEASLGGEERRMTVSFCDLADFTSLAERLTPEELVRHLGDYFGPLSDEIHATGGTVDKYIGDAIMAFWGAPAPSEDHAWAACESALRTQAELEALRARWRIEGKPELFARVGIMTGEVIVGNIGSESRLNYTVMGDPVNLASRLEGLGKHYGASILIGESTHREARSGFLARVVDRVSVKGKSEGMLVYELLGRSGDPRPGLEELAEASARAFDLYADRRWEEALEAYEAIGRDRPGDGPSRVMADRCRSLLDAPPADAWDGVYRMASK